MKNEVVVWEEDIVIPTYPIGKPEKNPMFLENRVYQGSSGVVYPHPVVESISDEKLDQVYQAVYIENEFIKLMILPQLGGRIQMAYDKIRQRHFIYYNQVIKPALVGLTGPWISGGIEFNWPQHHRPSTFQPVDYTIRENPDGSKTVWLNEVERMFRTKGMAGITLYPGKAYIAVNGRLYNRTPFPQTFLWWANPAVKVNDDYQSVFPPDVYAVFDHGKRDVSSFPIARGTYYKVDYSPGTDISRYKNIPVPTSYMAITSKYNFIGGYEHDTRAGLLHVADHHISPGKKQWTWGNGAFGRAWDKNLTDEDGPYIELMTGVYTDNQPDFSWLQPFEQKEFTQYFMPYAEVGMVQNASKDLVMAMNIAGNEVQVKIYATGIFKNARIEVLRRLPGKEEQDQSFALIYSKNADLAPDKVFQDSFTPNPDYQPNDLKLSVRFDNKILLELVHEKKEDLDIPAPAKAPKQPAEVESNELLFLTGLHLEQYRHATYRAMDYYEEAVKRDPKDIRANNAIGLLKLRQGHFVDSETYFRRAIATATRYNPNPYDGEPYYNLGWSLMLQGRLDSAFDAFYKSTWNQAWQHAGYLNLARIACAKKDFTQALELVDQSIIRNYHSHTARHLKLAILNRLDSASCRQLAERLREESLELDPFNFGCLFEQMKTCEDPDEAEEIRLFLLKRCSGNVHNLIECAMDYIHAGLFDEAEGLLSIHTASHPVENTYPMVWYYLGWIATKQGHTEAASAFFKQAAGLGADYCFPNRIEDVPVLQLAMERNPADARAPYYLGNFWYDKRQYAEAVQCWERSASIDDRFPTVFRNLSLAYYNKQQDQHRALTALEKAFSLDKTDARVLMELDQLFKRLNHSHLKRLEFLDLYARLVESRDDLTLERITLLNQLGRYEEARKQLAGRQFHPWEGGEGKVVNQYLVCHLELARQALQSARYSEALGVLEQAENYPDNLGEGKLPGAAENDIHYLKGVALLRLGDLSAASDMFKLATQGNSEPAQAIFYNDPQPDKILYQGLAWIEMDEPEKAGKIFGNLISFGQRHMNDRISIDYFAVSLPELLVFEVDLDQRNRIHCLYLVALGKLGQAMLESKPAGNLFQKVLELDINHQGAALHKNLQQQLATSTIVK